MAPALFKKDVYIRFADQPATFVYTVKYGRFSLKSARILLSSWVSQTPDVDGQCDDAPNTVKQLMRRPNTA